MNLHFLSFCFWAFSSFFSQLNLWLTHGFLGICSCSPWQLLMTAVKVLFMSSKDKKPSVIFLQIQILSTVKIFKVLYYCQKLLCPVSQTVLAISMGIKINTSYKKPNSMSLKHDSYLHIMLFIPPRFIMTVKMISLCLTCLTAWEENNPFFFLYNQKLLLTTSNIARVVLYSSNWREQLYSLVDQNI